MKKLIVAEALCALVFVPAVALAQAAGDDASKPIKPGGVRMTRHGRPLRRLRWMLIEEASVEFST
jgi:hypothetical protein